MGDKIDKLQERIFPSEHEGETEKICAMVGIVLFVAALTAMGVLSLLLPKPLISEIERRELAKKPDFSATTVLSGEYTTELDAFYSDTFPFREQLVAFGNFLAESRGVTLDDVRIHDIGDQTPVTPPSSTVPPASQAGEQEDNSSSDQTQSSVSAPPVTDDGATGEFKSSVFIYKGRAYQMFGGGYDMGRWYADTVNAYANALGNKVQIYDMIIPSPAEFYLPEKYRNLSVEEKSRIDNIYENLKPSIKKVDAYSKLAQHTDEYLYFNTDHHWTALGAYYAYTAFAEQAGFDPLPLSDFELRRKDNFLGSLYNLTQDSSLKDHMDYVDYYLLPVEYKAYRFMPNAPYTPIETSLHAEYATGTNSYSVFLHGDYPLIRVDTRNHNGRKILIVKDSFGNAFSPFLVPHYEQVYIVDQRYFQLGLINFIQQNDINELVFAGNIFAAHTPYHIEKINGMMYQEFIPPSQRPSSSTPPESSESEDDRFNEDDGWWD